MTCSSGRPWCSRTISRHAPHAQGSPAAWDHSDSWLAPTDVRRGATIGAGAVVVAGVTIGEFAFVAAGAVVTRDVAPHTLVKGNPGAAIGLRLPLRVTARTGDGCTFLRCRAPLGSAPAP